MGKTIELSDHALEIASSRYFNDGENWETCTERVARSISEPESDRQGYNAKFHEMLYNMEFIAGGRIMRNSGRNKGSLFNCYVLPIGDSIEEIGQFKKEALTLWSMGGGVGCNWSSLRPKDDAILGKGGKSSGLVSFLETADFDARQIESGGDRRAAALACVEVTHPEIMDFIDAKISHGKLTCHNISVGITNEFLEAVELDRNWEFKFKQRSYGKVKARTIWNKIVDNMLNHAEPGLLNFSNLFKNNSYYYDPVVSTNPCGEAVLSPHDICCLGSIVLPNFITNVNTNWKKLESTIKLAIRFLDNVIEMNKYVLKENDIKAHNSRRIGLGVLGLAEYLFSKGLRYGSEKSLAEVDRLIKFIKECAYQASIELAVEKGAFSKFDPIQYSKASFVRKLPLSMRMEIKEKGIRNVTCLSFAPTGTISLLTDFTSGIEPLFSKAYKRNDRVSERDYIHPRYVEFIKIGEEIPDWFVDSFDIEPKAHFEMQQTVQKHVDAAVSKTINLPSSATFEDLDSLLLESVKDLKGVTVYRDGTRDGQPLKRMTEEEALEQLGIGEYSKTFKMADVKCATGSCEI